METEQLPGSLSYRFSAGFRCDNGTGPGVILTGMLTGSWNVPERESDRSRVCFGVFPVVQGISTEWVNMDVSISGNRKSIYFYTPTVEIDSMLNLKAPFNYCSGQAQPTENASEFLERPRK